VVSQKKFVTAAIGACLTAGSAWAYGDHMDWDCDNGIVVNVGTVKETEPWKTGVYFAPSNPDMGVIPIAITRKDKGEVSLKIKWDFASNPPKVWLNGKLCHYMSDMDWYRRWCAKDPNLQECENLK
jgi:hypothetical protein